MRPLLVIGSSGHAGAVLDAIELQGRYEVLGLLDSFESKGAQKLGYTVIGTPEEAAAIAESTGCRSFFVAIGDNWGRWQLSCRLAALIPDIEFATVVHPSVLVSKSARIGPGAVIMAGSIVATYAHVGEGCIVYTISGVNHNCRMDDYSSISGGVHLGGASVVGLRSSVGIGATVREKVNIGRDSVIGAGSVVLDDVPEESLVYGSPARVVRTRRQDERYMR